MVAGLHGETLTSVIVTWGTGVCLTDRLDGWYQRTLWGMERGRVARVLPIASPSFSCTPLALPLAGLSLPVRLCPTHPLPSQSFALLAAAMPVLLVWSHLLPKHR